jgi:putative aminopeptidase
MCSGLSGMIGAIMKRLNPVALLAFVLLAGVCQAQSLGEIRDNLTSLTRISAVTGHEQVLAGVIVEQLRRRGLDPKTDAMSNVTVTVGSGKPHRMLVANLDEPGFIVSGITEDGYLRIQRIGTSKPFAYFDQYFEGQRLTIRTAAGRSLTGVMAIPSTHLARGGNRIEKTFDLGDGYIDMGRRSAAEVKAAGIQILDPVSIEKTVTNLAHDHLSGPFISDRVGASILMSILTTTPTAQINGTVTFAFTAQEHFGRKGLDRLTVAYEPDEVYIVEPFNPEQLTDTTTNAKNSVAIDTQAAPAVRKVLQRFSGLRDAALRPIPQTPQWRRGTPVTRVGVPIMFLATPVEALDLRTAQATIQFLRTIVQFGLS